MAVGMCKDFSIFIPYIYLRYFISECHHHILSKKWKTYFGPYYTPPPTSSYCYKLCYTPPPTSSNCYKLCYTPPPTSSNCYKLCYTPPPLAVIVTNSATPLPPLAVGMCKDFSIFIPYIYLRYFISECHHHILSKKWKTYFGPYYTPPPTSSYCYKLCYTPPPTSSNCYKLCYTYC